MATTAKPRTPTRRPALISRFDRVERAVHWCNATLFGVLIFTGAALYLPQLTAVVGRRELIERIHLYCGLALPVPLILALSGSWGRALREDLRRFNRWTDDDRRWIRYSARAKVVREHLRSTLRVGKFNAGQKLNAAFTAGAGLVMLATGCMLRWYRRFPLSWRAGATFVHNWLALVFVVVIAGHILMALSDSESFWSMVRGHVSRSWARRHAPAWLDELAAASAPVPAAVPPGAAPGTEAAPAATDPGAAGAPPDPPPSAP